MDILSALFIENFNMRQVSGPATRIDMTGAMFSLAAPAPVPVTVEPHMLVLVRCHDDEPGDAVLEVVFKNEAGEQVARSVMPFQVEPGKFGFRLVRGELTYEEYGTIEANVRLNKGDWLKVPLTLLPPVED